MGYMLLRLIAGGNWNNGVNAGCRAVNWNNYPWNVNASIGARFGCDLWTFRLSKLRLTSKDYFHIVRTYSPSGDLPGKYKKGRFHLVALAKGGSGNGGR